MNTNLVIQGTEVTNADLRQLAKLSSAYRIEAIAGVTGAEQAFRLLGADPASAAAVAAHCEPVELDFGFVPQARKPGDFGLAVMDMDSTLITIECIDEIADLMGLKAPVAAITAAAMRGEIDFGESLRRRVCLLAGLPLSALDRVYRERLKLSPGTEAMLAGFKIAGVKTLLVSGGFSFFADRLAALLGLDFCAANTLAIVDGKLTGEVLGELVDADAKASWLVKIRDQLGLSTGQVIGIGDGANDLKMLAAAGISIAYRAKPVVRSQANYALNFTGLAGVLHLLAGS